MWNPNYCQCQRLIGLLHNVQNLPSPEAQELQCAGDEAGERPEPVEPGSASGSACSSPCSDSGASHSSIASACSWHGTPTWIDMTTFSQVSPCHHALSPWHLP